MSYTNLFTTSRRIVCDISNVLCLQETWHKTYDDIDDSIYIKSKKFLHKPATKAYSKGRFSGGLAFIVDENLKCNSEFLNNRIGILKINKLAIINVYLIHFNGSKSSTLEYEADISLINNAINNLKSNGYETILMGDFNTDFSKNNSHTNKTINQTRNDSS